MPKSYKERKRSVEVMLGVSSPAQRTNVYVALLAGDPGYDNSNLVQVGTRATVSSSSWTVDSSGRAVNNSDITISSLPELSSVTHWAIFTSASAGDLIAYGRLPFRFARPHTDTPPYSYTIGAGQLSIQET